MNTRQKPKQTGRTVTILLVLVIAFALLWGVTTLLARVLHYGQTATVSEPEPIPEPEPVPVPEEKDPYADLPRNTYDPEAFYEEGGFLRYDGRPKGRVGVDVSSHQGEIDWEAVAEAGVEFAMIQVGYRGYTAGTISPDKFFERNIEGALAAGLEVGVYFFSQAISLEEAIEEAEYVVRQLRGYDVTYPVVFDWEDIEAEARTDDMDMIALTACADAFCRVVEAEGYTAGVYFNQRLGYQELNLISLQPYVLWLAEYNPTPSFAYHFDMWQYTCEGTVPGIDTVVDLNLSFFE